MLVKIEGHCIKKEENKIVENVCVAVISKGVFIFVKDVASIVLVTKVFQVALSAHLPYARVRALVLIADMDLGVVCSTFTLKEKVVPSDMFLVVLQIIVPEVEVRLEKVFA